MAIPAVPEEVPALIVASESSQKLSYTVPNALPTDCSSLHLFVARVSKKGLPIYSRIGICVMAVISIGMTLSHCFYKFF